MCSRQRELAEIVLREAAVVECDAVFQKQGDGKGVQRECSQGERGNGRKSTDSRDLKV